jgi:hypothetical protein
MGMPIVETPQDALLCFLSTGIDYCVVEDVIVKKRDTVLLGRDVTPNYTPPQVDSSSDKESSGPAGMHSRRPLKEYVGDYDNPTGILKIEQEGNELQGIYNAQTTPLVRMADDLFEATSDAYKGFKVTFIPDKNGFIERAIIDMGEQGSAVFTREPHTLPASKKYMRKCAGKYAIGDRALKVALLDDEKMTITAAGQPDYVLVPGKGGKFDLKNTPGYSVEFIEEEDKITGAVVTQPNGSFLLTKVA